jgi:hypothetical protein
MMTDTETIDLLRDRTHELGNAIQVEREERKAFEADLVGKSGTNGKLGSLRSQLGIVRAVVAAVGVAALSGLGAGISAVNKLGEQRGIERARLEILERQVTENTLAVKSLTIWSEVLRLRLDINGGKQP